MVTSDQAARAPLSRRQFLIGVGGAVGAAATGAAAFEVMRLANGRLIDLHEFRLTPEGTALFTCYPQVVQTDLTPVGGPSNGQVFESVFQEVDVRTGKLLLEWRSLDHIPITESYQPVSEPH